MTIVQNDKTPKKWIFKPLSRSLHEISELFKLFNESSVEAQNALSIALTTAAIRMVEGIANTIIFSIPISDKLKDSLDYLKLIDKLDLCLYLRTQKQLDRGHHLLGCIVTMNKGRNELTHPHPLETEFESIEHHQDTDTIHFATKKNPYTTTKEGTLDNLRAIFAFLDEYLTNWTKCDNQFLSLLMSETATFGDGIVGTFHAKNIKVDREILESGLDIKIKFLAYL